MAQASGPHGEQYSTYPAANDGRTGRWPLGHYLVLPDGRKYRFTLNDATVEVAGNLYQASLPVANHDELVVSTVPAAGDTALVATLDATSAARDLYSEGTIHTNKATSLGYAYHIKRAMSDGEGHAAVASSGIITVNLEDGETVQVAGSGSTEVTLTKNRFDTVLIHASPPTAMLVGVSPGVCAASRYYWSQVSGEAAVLADGTLLVGNMVQASITVDGAVEGYKRRLTMGSSDAADTDAGTLAEDQDGNETLVRIMGGVSDIAYDITGPIAGRAPLVGICAVVNITAEYALIDLKYLGA